MRVGLFISLLFNFLGVLFIILFLFNKRVNNYTKKKLITNKLFKQSDYKSVYSLNTRLFRIMPKDTNAIIFIGNSITAGINWAELFNNIHIKNRGIGSDNSKGILNRIENTIQDKPSKVFLMVGINDILQNTPLKEYEYNVKAIISGIQKYSPQTSIYIQSILPISLGGADYSSIIEFNLVLKEICLKKHCVYIDLHSYFADENNRLLVDYSFDGIHLNSNGYSLWKKVIENKIYD